ncbi:MAG: hypothetical protein BRD35_06210 [Bacteroidetes bacterium QH_7_62_13]|nr:MAG: hypothetical protein BRD35_06210 [Bacteroidetes bacterium QH_7_62_13]
MVAVFGPRSNSGRRKALGAPYGEAFGAADRVFLKARPARAFEEVNATLPALMDMPRPGDVALLMSNGSFDGLPERLLSTLTPASAK